MDKTASKPVRSFEQARNERIVPDSVKEELKKFNRMKRAIRKTLEENPLTIPELAEKLEIERHEAMYYLMSLRKYGIIETGDLDDMDEYYCYLLKK